MYIFTDKVGLGQNTRSLRFVMVASTYLPISYKKLDLLMAL